MSNSIAPGSSADVNVRVTALTTNPNVSVQYKTIILKKNLVNGVNTLTQEMMSATNTKYVIKYDYVLGENITVPTGCILEFDGGSIDGNHTVTGQNTLVLGNYCFKVEVDGTFYKNIQDLKNNVADLTLLGCTADESNATKNVTIINYAVLNYNILKFNQVYPINNSIDASYNKKSYIGENRESSGLTMIADNLPIFDFKLKNASGAITLHDIEVKSLQLNYKIYQATNQNSIVFSFSTQSQTIYYYGWQQFNFENLLINNPYAVVNATVEPLWDDYYTDILAYNIAGYFFHTQCTAELQHIFKNIRILNYGHRTDSDHNADSCFYVRGGELHIDSLDLECWYGILIYSASGQISVKNSHFEHIVFTNDYGIFANGPFNFTSNHIVGRYINNNNTGYVIRIFSATPATILNNDISVTNETGKQFRYLRGASGVLRARIFTDFPFDTTTVILPAGYGDELLTNPYCIYQGGVKAPIATADRPTVTEVGFQIFDKTLGYPIYWNGSAWVDATGATV